jgi:hypothetical protein
MTLGVNPPSIPESPRSCNSRFLHHLGTIGAAVMGLFLTSNPMRTDTSYTTDLSNRAVVQRTEQVTTAVQPDEETDSDDDAMDVETATLEQDLLEAGFAEIEDELAVSGEDEMLSASASIEDTRIDPRVLNQGLIYEIYSPETDTYSFIMGTYHKIAFENLLVPCIIDKCEQVFTEIGTYGLSNSGESLEYDLQLARIAQNKNKKVIALDADRATALNASEEAALKLQESENNEALISAYVGTDIEPVLDEDPYAEAWQNGDLPFITKMRSYLCTGNPEVFNRLCTKREKAWMERISNELQKTKAPILIAVGMAHLVGDDGLIAQLRKKDFIVQKSTFSACAR